VDLTQAWTAGKDQGTRQMTSAQTGSGNREEAPAGVPTVTRRIASCDLGKAAAKFVTGTVDVRGRVAIEKAESVTHDGLPLEAFREWYRRADIASCAVLGATGLHADELAAPAIAGLPEDACLLAALHQRPDLAGPLNLVRVGARGYAVLTRDAGGRVQFLENDKCSSGTGETMVKIAGRFGFSIEEADGLAQAAQEAIPITARCSVFAKSEMTHFGNQGRPADALFRGYFTSIAGYVSALLARTRVDGPILLVGGCTRILSLVDALRDALGDEVSVPEDALHFEAIGATLLAAEQCAAGTLDALPTDPGPDPPGAAPLPQPRGPGRRRAPCPPPRGSACPARRRARARDPGSRPGLDGEQGGTHVCRQRRGDPRRLRHHAREPRRCGPAPDPGGARADAARRARAGPHGLGPGGGGNGAARGVPRQRGPHPGPERDRGPRHRGDSL
jgi:hypothetical protein